MGRIPEETIQAIRERVDIVDLVGRHVSLKKAGRTFKGLCPFHHEKTPSFVVTPERGTFHCFGCGEGGNAFAFLMRHEGLTFPEAVRSLAADVGIEVPETGGGEPGLLEQVHRANEVAQRFFRASLLAEGGAAARAYLERRGLGPEDVERFGIGFAPERWDGLASALARERVPAAMGERAGLLKARERGGHYDLLRGRVVFPIQDVRRRVIAFGGRALGPDQEPKYLNTPESPVFRKRACFYGVPEALEAIRRHDRAVIVEGYFDRIALARAGVVEALATCGTALTDDHARDLRRRTRNVVLLFDGDEAGQRAVLRALEELLPHGLRVRAAALPGGVDPDDYLRSEGPEALQRLVDEAPPALEVAIARAVAAGCRTPWERADAVAAVAPLLARVGDPVERGEYARQLALAAGTEPRDVEAAVQRERSGSSEEPQETPVVRRADTPEDRHFADVLRLLLVHRDGLPGVDADALCGLAPDAEWAMLLGLVLDAGPAGASGLLDRLEGEARRRLSALSAAERPDLDDPSQAPRILADELRWLERRRERRDAHALNQRFRSSGGDASELIQLKQRQLEQRRAARGVPRG